MKILFISMPSVHVIRWIANLKDTSYELYWFDVLGRGRLETLDSVRQFTAWKKRKLPYNKGEYFLGKRFPFLYKTIQPFLEVTANEALEKIILQIQPDIVHSFEMQSCSYPILKTMRKYPNIKWLYSCWGSDLFYYQQFPNHLNEIKKVLKKINYLHTDCTRDLVLARQFGFSGTHVGVIPGGAGYDLSLLDEFKQPICHRKIILVKGYEHQFGRGLNIVKALHLLEHEIQDFEVVVFGAHTKVIDYIEFNHLNFKFFDRQVLSHQELMALMGKSLLYIGNSISDGMPNTLLEAIVMGVFPIQSNPGGTTAEIVNHKKNGLLIDNTEDVAAIKDLIILAISNSKMRTNAFEENQIISRNYLDYNSNQQKIVDLYQKIENDLCE
ncbi:glycosyltransferase family 4 protein [Flavobacterium sp. Sr18]|uniref:glycosyltransferase family 4 protein n=1 Tax=Flavobacterium sp. Sr18 TaxID=935222 RepID=UPI0013E43A4C|nr:glycosyltransferase family 4 protein [Flavobacterium sp. Sr18]QIH39524.1 glycosyltransferase family 4 protein [Flavobacterium sp. Sr18]